MITFVFASIVVPIQKSLLEHLRFSQWKVRPCIPNLNSNVWVGIRVGTSFSWFSKFNFNIIFCNFRKNRNRTNFKYSVNLECLETPVFDPKTPVFDPNLFPNYFCKIFASSKKLDISEKFPNFDNQTIPKLTKTKSSENSVVRRALMESLHQR